MLGSPSSLAWSMALLLVGTAAACGLRSDPFAPDFAPTEAVDPTDGDTDPGDPNRPGTCNDPLPMAFVPATLRGDLSGPSFSEGWCGSDGGPEDVYVLTPDYDIDVVLTLDAAETDFTPTLRVIEDGCTAGMGFTKICTRTFAEQPYHFLAQAGHTYAVIIDSRAGGSGGYAFDVAFERPALELCDVHPQVIEQVSGSSFLWNNEFNQGQGRVDGYCGGPGRENMFPLVSSYPGNMYAFVETSGGFSPVLSLRTECAAISELTCAAGPPGGAAELAYFLGDPGVYYLVVDQADIGAGGYSLRVDFD